MRLGEAIERYVREREKYAGLAQIVVEVLEEVAASREIECRIVGREKDPHSYIAKVVSKGYSDAWNDVTDKAGARVIVDYAPDVNEMVAAIRLAARLRLIRTEDRRQVIDPASLAYGGVHVQVALEAPESDLDGLECEVQLRTAAQDAWSALSHKLLYKPVIGLSGDLQHAMYRLVSLVELFDLEVGRVMDALPTQPGYEYSQLVRTLEAEFLGIAHYLGRRDLTLHVLEALRDVIPSTPDYLDVLRSYVCENRDSLGVILQRYGPGSEMFDVPGYTLFGQAESLAILERLSVAPLEMQRAWAESDLPQEWLDTLGSVVDAPGTTV